MEKEKLEEVPPCSFKEDENQKMEQHSSLTGDPRASDANEVDMPVLQNDELKKENAYNISPTIRLEENVVDIDHVELPTATISQDITELSCEMKSDDKLNELKVGDNGEAESRVVNEENSEEVVSYQEEDEPIFDGTEVVQGSAWPEKAVALTNFVRQKSLVAVSTVLSRFSGKNDGQDVSSEEKNCSQNSDSKGIEETEGQEISKKSAWNPLSFIQTSSDASGKNVSEQENCFEYFTPPSTMKGRIILYTRLGCQNCREMRTYLHQKRLRYVEINIDVFPTRKLELEKIAGSCTVPTILFNEVLIGGWSELKSLEESGKLAEKIEHVVTELPSYEAPLPPLSGEDDLSSSGAIDELALIVRKMKECIAVKDRFCKMRRFVNCFLGSEAVDFLSKDQYLDRKEAVEFGRKLARNHFFQHVLDENVFEDGNHVYRCLDDDPIISQCQNIPRGISEVKPKPVAEISSRLRFLTRAILEAYTSENGKHVDYRSIHGSEEFARYLRIVEELQRVELYEMPREEKLSFFINLSNMMAIHALLVWGHPSGAMERRKLFGDFKYVIGGSIYSLSAIYNGVLRGNQRPPYNLIKPFGVKDKRIKVALPFTEPLVHFALVFGTRSGPALQCYSPGNIDKELMDAACNFLRTGGLHVDMVTNVAYASTILKWYSVDFGKNEVEVLKHAANYLEPAESRALLELLSETQLKVIYQPYDWGLNN